jgi:predicted transposase YbfD/YdcC
MQTDQKPNLSVLFSTLKDPRVVGRCDHDLVEMLVVAICAVLCGADTFVEITLWAQAKLEWLQRFLKLENGIASHDTYGRLFALLDGGAFEACFRRWVSEVLPALAPESVVAIDGKTSRRSHRQGMGALHMVSAFAVEAGLVIGQQACAEKSNEITAIPLLLETLMIQGAIVTIDAIGTHAPIAQAIRDRQAYYVLAVKDNQPLLAESIQDFFTIGQQAQWHNTEHDYFETVEKDHGRIETRRYWAFHHLACLSRPEQWPDLRMFGIVESERSIVGGKTTVERRAYIGSIAADAQLFAHAVRSHWAVENQLHWCLDVGFDDDQARARVENAAENLTRLKRMALNLIRLDSSRKGGIKARRLVAATSDQYRSQLLGLQEV